MLKGIPASPGIAIGQAFLLDYEDLKVEKRKLKVSEIPNEVVRFEEALIKTHNEIKEIQKSISKSMGIEQGEIFNAHLLVLEDRMLIEDVIIRIKKEKVCVEAIFEDVLNRYIRVFSKMDDEYLRERMADINDVGKRVLRNLLGQKAPSLSSIKGKVIVIAYDLSPSDTASMHRRNVMGFATDIGGRTSHTAIMAKSLEIPAVVGLERVTEQVKNGDTIIVDGIKGEVVINPDKKTISHYRRVKEKLEEFGRGLLKLKDLPGETIDRHQVELCANIEMPDEIPSVLAHGASGIGLYRTEYFYMSRPDLPDEEEQFESYRDVVLKIKPNPVVIRTLDLGGDKFISQFEIPHEMNPFLGWRAIRFCLAKPEIFKIHLRAILRASAFGKLKIMYPMISGVGELKQANVILEEAKAELRKKKMKFDNEVEVGAMIEIPSAALTADAIAKEADFFSIGSNDLIQYTLAVDRVNEKIAYLYDPAHPAVLRLIKNIIDAGHANNIPVSMCGEMAGEPILTLLLIGMGIDGLSMSPVLVPEIKRLVRSIKFADAKKIADAALELHTGKDVQEYALKKIKELVPEWRM